MPAQATASAPAVKLATLAEMKSRAERIAMLTAYDAVTARIFDDTSRPERDLALTR